MIFMQGDAYYIPFLFFDDDAQPITDDMLDDLEIVFGNVRKTLGAILYDDGAFLFPLTQEESFGMDSTVKIQARLKFKTGDVLGASLGHVVFLKSDSQEAL